MERLLQRDGVVRLLSLLLAVILWVQITDMRSADVTRRIVAVPLQVEGIGPDLVLQAPQSLPPVDVTLQGPARDVERVQPGDLFAFLNLAGLGPGQMHSVRVQVRGVPPSVSYTVEPNVVSVFLEQRVSRTAPLTLARPEIVRGDEKFVLRLQQETVRLNGLRPDVDRVARVEAAVDPRSLEGEGSREAAVVALDASGAEVRGVTVVPARVPVEVSVVRLPPARDVPVHPRFVGSLPDGYTFSVSVSPATVKVRGPRERQAAWQEVATEPINLNGQTRPFAVQVGLILPQGAESMDYRSATVTVNITELQTERVLTDQPLQVRGVGDGLSARPAVSGVTVRLYGPKLALDRLDPAALGLHVDASGRGPGRYLLDVQYTAPPGIEVLSVAPSAVEVILSGPGSGPVSAGGASST